MPNTQPSSFNISFFDMKKAKRNFDASRRYVVGYARLSFDEDGENFVSIENQMSILEDFYHQQYENATSEYHFISDDNVSGYKFERDGLYRLMSLIEDGKCNIILAKDLSRIGRHGALTQLFIEQCERVGVRIHAMSDYDSTKESDDLILGIRAWSNERVVKDTSVKIKKIIQHKQNNGTWFCSAPFGYYVIDYQKGKVGIIEEAAKIVRRIFDMYIEGIGMARIAKILTNEHVPTPNMFLQERALANGDEFKRKISANWTATCISTILSNEFYIGTLVTGRYQRDGINGKDLRTSKDTWKKHENHHESIIDKETFDAAQRIKEEHSKYNYRPKNCREHLFHGIVRCGECGAVEYAYAAKGLATQYICSNYFKYRRDRCTRHRVKESLLINIAINFLKLARESCREVIDSLDSELFPKRAVSNDKETIEHMEKELSGLDTQLQIIEEQRIKQIITHPEREDSINTIYDNMVKSTQTKRNELAERIESIKAHLASTASSIKKAKKAIDVIDQVIESGTLTRNAILSIFDKITVYEDGNIDIELKPYLEILDPKSHSVVTKSYKRPEEVFMINHKGNKRQNADNTQTVDEDQENTSTLNLPSADALIEDTEMKEAGSVPSTVNDVCEGDPLHTSFIHAITLLICVNRLASNLSFKNS